MSMDLPSIHELTILAHLIGVSLSFGGALVTDFLFFYTLRQKEFVADLIKVIGLISNLIWVGAILVIGSGLVLFFETPNYYLENSQFWAKMIIVTIVLLNGAWFHFYHYPLLKKLAGKSITAIKDFPKRRELLLVSGIFSSTSWLSALFLGSTLYQGWPLIPLLVIYFGIIGLGIITTQLGKNLLFPIK